jgi:hypothetical protein
VEILEPSDDSLRKGTSFSTCILSRLSGTVLSMMGKEIPAHHQFHRNISVNDCSVLKSPFFFCGILELCHCCAIVDGNLYRNRVLLMQHILTSDLGEYSVYDVRRNVSVNYLGFYGLPVLVYAWVF